MSINPSHNALTQLNTIQQGIAKGKCIIYNASKKEFEAISASDLKTLAKEGNYITNNKDVASKIAIFVEENNFSEAHIEELTTTLNTRANLLSNRVVFIGQAKNAQTVKNLQELNHMIATAAQIGRISHIMGGEKLSTQEEEIMQKIPLNVLVQLDLSMHSITNLDKLKKKIDRTVDNMGDIRISEQKKIAGILNQAAERAAAKADLISHIMGENKLSEAQYLIVQDMPLDLLETLHAGMHSIRSEEEVYAALQPVFDHLSESDRVIISPLLTKIAITTAKTLCIAHIMGGEKLSKREGEVLHRIPLDALIELDASLHLINKLDLKQRDSDIQEMMEKARPKALQNIHQKVLKYIGPSDQHVVTTVLNRVKSTNSPYAQNALPREKMDG